MSYLQSLTVHHLFVSLSDTYCHIVQLKGIYSIVYAFQYIPVHHLTKHKSNTDPVCQWFKWKTVKQS